VSNKGYKGHYLSLLFLEFELFTTLYFGTDGVFKRSKSGNN
jgi:hypothetical protein